MTERARQEKEFLIVEVGNQRFGFATDSVASALAPRDVTPLPFVPAFVEGLVNVNDRVLALINLASLFAMPDSTDAPRSELLVLETGRVPCAVRVDRIVAKAEIASDEIEAIVADDESAHHAIAHARFGYLDDTVLVLNPTLIGDLVTSRELTEGERGMLGRHQQEDESRVSLNHALAFSVSGEHYAFALQQVVEILDDTLCTPLPGAGTEIEGLARVRDDVLLVVSLARLLGLPAASGGHRQILVLELDGRFYGLRVDQVIGTVAYDDEQVRAIDDQDSPVVGVFTHEHQLIGILSRAQLITPARQQRWSGLMPRRRANEARVQEASREVLEVRLGDEVYGVPLALVRTISELTDFDQINPDDTGLICGAAHIKGKVLPVVDFGELLHCLNHTTDLNGRGAWIVLGEGEHEWAVPVAEAKQIRVIPESAIETVEDSRGRFVSAIANFNQQLLPLISIRPLLKAG